VAAPVTRLCYGWVDERVFRDGSAMVYNAPNMEAGKAAPGQVQVEVRERT
jgi:hypothetical protein